MAVSSARRRLPTCLVLAMLACLGAPPAEPAASAPRDAIVYSSDEGEADLSNDVHVLRGNVRVAQGEMSLAADEAIIRDPQSDRSRWTFQRNVHIETPEIDLRSDAATAVVIDGRLADARVTGSPAEFVQRASERGEMERPVRGRAGTIEYDLTHGVITLSENVWFSFGENEFRGDTVVYNLREERVQVNPGGRSPSRVNITIRPGSLEGDGDRQPPADEAPAAKHHDPAEDDA